MAGGPLGCCLYFARFLQKLRSLAQNCCILHRWRIGKSWLTLGLRFGGWCKTRSILHFLMSKVEQNCPRR